MHKIRPLPDLLKLLERPLHRRFRAGYVLFDCPPQLIELAISIRVGRQLDHAPNFDTLLSHAAGMACPVCQAERHQFQARLPVAKAFEKTALLCKSHTFGKVLSCADEETQRVKLFNLPAQVLPQGNADAAPAKGRSYDYTHPQLSRMVQAQLLLVTGVASRLAVQIGKEASPLQCFGPFLVAFLPLLCGLLLPNPNRVEDVDRLPVVCVRRLAGSDCNHCSSSILAIGRFSFPDPTEHCAQLRQPPLDHRQPRQWPVAGGCYRTTYLPTTHTRPGPRGKRVRTCEDAGAMR